MPVPSFHFEAKKHAYRQTQDGIVVSFVMNPVDVNAAFAAAPLGTRFMLAVAQIGDDEQPVPPGAPDGSARKASSTEGSEGVADGPLVAPHAMEANGPAPGGHKERRPFASLPLPQQVALRCADEKFQAWLAREEQDDPASFDEATTAAVVRMRCEVHSRSEIKTGSLAEVAWRRLEAQFLQESGQLPEVRG